MCSHEAITDVSLTGSRGEFTGYLRERGIVALGNRKIVVGGAYIKDNVFATRE